MRLMLQSETQRMNTSINSLRDAAPPSEQPYWNSEIETISPDLLAAMQLHKLRGQVRYLAQNSTMYKETFSASAFVPEDLKTIDDLAQLPFTTKDNLRKSQEAYPPFGYHQAAPSERVVRVTTTAGTTGRPVVQAYTRRDVMHRNESVCRALWSFGVRPGDRVINGFSLSMFNAGVPFCTAIEHLGATSIPAGAEKKADGLLRIAKDLSATVLIATPSFARYLAERCPDILGIEARDLGIRIVGGGGEPGFELDGVRQELEAAWGTTSIFDLASTSDAHPNSFANCSCRTGKHHLTGDMVLVQLIDPISGKLIEIADGAVGEYIFTHLDRESCPLLRYRTNDIVKVSTKPCPCGRTSYRVDIIGRSDDMLIVRGMNVFPSAVQSIVARFRPALSGRMQIMLDAPGPAVAPPLQVVVERGESTGMHDLAALKSRVETAIREALSVTATITILEPHVLEPTTGKAKLIFVRPGLTP